MLTACCLKFQKVTTRALAEIAPYFGGMGATISDHSVLYLHMWGEMLGTEYAISNGVLYLRRNGKNGVSYYPPMLKDEASLEVGLSHLTALGEKRVRLCAVPQSMVEVVEKHTNVLEKGTSRRWADYIYSAEDLATLKGHRYNKKRNLVHQFERLYPAHTYEELGGANVKEVIDFMHRFMSESEQNEDKRYENERVLHILEEYESLPAVGGLVRVDGEIAAFTVGELIGETLLVHVEKADRRFKGAYQYINYRFVGEQLKAHAFSFVNREDDAGDEGLRHAKLSYFPVDILHKYYMILEF